jgi:serine/threonine protein phosphatase PrpC
MTTAGPLEEASACPTCGQPVWPGDIFCEACGAELAAARAAVCVYCHAGRLGQDGYCELCGRKAPSGRDHCEADLGLLAGVTDRGLRHIRNEDAMALAAVQAPGGATAIAVVCDGVSESARPDQASLTAAKTALGVLLSAARQGGDPSSASSQAIEAAQAAVAKLADGPDAPSATFVSAVVTAEAVTLCWLGDSRAYWLDATEPSAARPLTTDDSLAAQMVSAGLLSEAEAMASPQAHVVTGWLGADVSDAAPHVSAFVPPGPGVVLVCSDGLWNYEPEAAKLASRALPAARHDPLGAAQALTGFALARGGHDNVTVALIPFPPAGPAGPVRVYPDDLMDQAAVKEIGDE